MEDDGYDPKTNPIPEHNKQRLNMTNALKKYLELQKECNSLAHQWKFQESRNLRKNAISIMNEFTKEDWQKLIDMTPNIHAKIDWTRMMNERFPESK